MPDLIVEWRLLGADRYAATNGIDRIWMDPRQGQAERRCSLAHELAHIELGHVDGCTGADEEHAADLAARRLIEIERLADTLAWTRDLDEAAEALWVDRGTLDVRLEHLDDAERRHLREHLAACERGA